jgi:hypothetical protein
MADFDYNPNFSYVNDSGGSLFGTSGLSMDAMNFGQGSNTGASSIPRGDGMQSQAAVGGGSATGGAGIGEYVKMAAPVVQQFAGSMGGGDQAVQQGSNSQLGYGGNMNYPNYSAGANQKPIEPVYGGDPMVSAGSDALDKAGDAGLMSGNPYGMIAGGVAKVASKGLDMYGKYKEREEAKKRYKAALKAWEEAETERKQRQAMEDRRAERKEAYFAGNYAQDLMTDYLGGQYTGQRQPG